jgi:RimJ/RimL family protein N-acetyltransferase
MLAHSRLVIRIALPTLTDGEITLRPKRIEDADAITAACQDPEIQRWTLVPASYTRENALAHLAAVEEQAAEGRAVGLLAVDGDGVLLASISLMGLDGGTPEIGYWVAAEARGRGVATRAVRLLTEWGHAELGLPEIELLIHRDNVPSRRAAERAGFVATGELRPAPRGEPSGADYLVYLSTAVP